MPAEKDPPEEPVEQPLRLQAADVVAPLRLASPAQQPQEPRPTPAPFAPPFALTAPPPPPAAAASVARPPPGFTLPEGARWTGEQLRRAREARGLSIAQLAERTKITRHHLEAVEGDHRERLPALVYLRGILMAVAKELRLDGQKVSRSYLDAMRDGAGP